MRADLHVHTDRSYDGRSSLFALCEAAATQGIDALAICDHNLCTDVSGDYPVTLIPAVEITSQKGHVLGLFLERPIDPVFLQSTPTPEAAIDAIHACGGLAVLAHPFAPQKLTEAEAAALDFDAIECENARAATKSRLYNHKARALAEKLSLPMLGGSDAHCDKELGGCITELACEGNSLAAMKAAIQSGACTPVFHHACRRTFKGLSQWKKHRRSPLGKRLRALCYLIYCVLFDVLKRR